MVSGNEHERIDKTEVLVNEMVVIKTQLMNLSEKLVKCSKTTIERIKNGYSEGDSEKFQDVIKEIDNEKVQLEKRMARMKNELMQLEDANPEFQLTDC